MPGQRGSAEKHRGEGGWISSGPPTPSYAPRSDSIPSALNQLRILPVATGVYYHFFAPFQFSTLCLCAPACPDLVGVANPMFSAVCRLFVAPKKANPFAITEIQPLFAKHPGGCYRSCHLASPRGAGSSLKPLAFSFQITCRLCTIPVRGRGYDSLFTFVRHQASAVPPIYERAIGDAIATAHRKSQGRTS
jgi:hypothetical protein